MDLQPGSSLGPYLLRARLGAGAMGEVYRALDPRLGREVAIKVLPEESASSPRALGRFEREARAVAALSHPNVLVVHDVGADGPLRYVVTELLHGETLLARLGVGPVPWRQAVTLAAEAAEGLQAAHARGIVHRDLKPANLFLTREGRLKILDFGVARFVQGDDIGDSGERTLPGSVLGSIGYMSPEQAAGRELDGRSDLFSLGCVLYEMLGARRAFGGGSLPETLAALARDEPRSLREVAPQTPSELVAIVERCLRKQPSERWRSAGELAVALRSLLTRSDEERRVDDNAARAAQNPGGPGWMGRWLRVLAAALPRRGGARSLAVLPFAGSGDPDGDYLADGLSESIIRTLTGLPDLHVMAWSTVAHLRSRPLEPRQAATALGVDVVLVGRVAERAHELVVTAELVEGATGKCLWAERYSRPAADLLEVQEQIARQLSRRLQTRLSGSDSERLGRRFTSDSEAYRLYLKGRYFWNRRGEDGLARSREQFRAAIARDPGYALAYAGLADAQNVLPFWGLAPPAEAFVQGKAAARTALELDPNLAEAHASLAYALFWFDWEWPSAQAEFRAAVDLDPGYATAHHWYGVALAATGAFSAAEASLRVAEELEPLALIIRADQGLVRYWQGDWEGACSRCRAVLDLDPDFVPAHLYLGLAREQLGAADDALEALRRAAEGGGTNALAALAHAFAAAGELELARQGLAQLTELAASRYVSPYLLGVLHVGLGEPEAALEWLERAAEGRCEMMPWLPRDPRLQPLARHPRFVNLARRVGLGRADGSLPRTIADTPSASAT
jgi:TolB-like protein